MGHGEGDVLGFGSHPVEALSCFRSSIGQCQDSVCGTQGAVDEGPGRVGV